MWVNKKKYDKLVNSCKYLELKLDKIVEELENQQLIENFESKALYNEARFPIVKRFNEFINFLGYTIDRKEMSTTRFVKIKKKKVGFLVPKNAKNVKCTYDIEE